jgi:hypothetical protein
MAKTLLLLEINRGDVTDDLCGGCRFAKPVASRNSAGRKSCVRMWCGAFMEACAGTFDQPRRLEVCEQAEAEAFK